MIGDLPAAPADVPLPTGEGPGLMVDGRYRLGAVLGRGATASVYRTWDERLGRDVALKLFTADLAESPDPQRRYEAEIRLLAAVNHPALVTLHDAGTDASHPGGARPYLVMDLIEGRDLRRVLAGGQLPAGQVALIGADLASAVAHIHARGIIHRDLKPANILIPEAGSSSGVHAMLTDFGIARIIDGSSLTATGATIGTAAYFSPEQASGGALGPASDIYSLGLVLLQALTGVLEYPGNPAESAVARLHRAPRIPQGLGPAWTDLLTAMTAMDPGDRPAAAEVELRLRRTAAGTLSPLMAATHALPVPPSRAPRSAAEQVLTRFLVSSIPEDARDGADIQDTDVAVHRKPAAARPVAPVFPSVPAQPPGPSTQRVTRTIPASPARRPWIRSVALRAVAAVAVLAATVLILISLVAPEGTPAQSPHAPVYPVVSGALGAHLQQLQKEVRP